MKLQIKNVVEEKTPRLEDLIPGQLFLDTVGCINLVVRDAKNYVDALVYWDEGRPILASEDTMAETEVDCLLTSEDLEFLD